MSPLPYRKLHVWQRSQALAEQVLDLAEEPPFQRRFYFQRQMCDAAMSVPANIAEGNGRSTPLDYASFIDRSRGSLFELDSWLFMAATKGWLARDRYDQFEDEIGQLSAMLLTLASRLRQQSGLPSRLTLREE